MVKKGKCCTGDFGYYDEYKNKTYKEQKQIGRRSISPQPYSFTDRLYYSPPPYLNSSLKLRESISLSSLIRKSSPPPSSTLNDSTTITQSPLSSSSLFSQPIMSPEFLRRKASPSFFNSSCPSLDFSDPDSKK
jgi:hypothetical protein